MSGTFYKLDFTKKKDLTSEEVEWLDDNFVPSDDGTFYVDEYSLQEVIADCEKAKETIPTELVTIMKAEIEKSVNKGFSFSF